MTVNEPDLDIDFVAEAYAILDATPEHGFACAQDAFYTLIEGADHDYKVELVEAYEILKQDRYPFMRTALPTDFVTTVDKERYYAENIAYALDCDGVIEHYKELDELLETTLKINQRKPIIVKSLIGSFAAAIIGLLGESVPDLPSTIKTGFDVAAKLGGTGVCAFSVLGIADGVRKDNIEDRLRVLENKIYETGSKMRPAGHAQGVAFAAF